MPGTYRERREARADRLRDWADKRTEKADALHARNEPFRGDIAFNTQPGHIPERARVIARTEQAWEHSQKAASMTARAAEIDRQAAHAIYRDDPDELDRLREKLAGLEAERDRIKAYNVTCRRGTPDPSILDAHQRGQVLGSCFVKADGQAPGYVLSNLGGTITATRKRIIEAERRTERTDTP